MTLPVARQQVPFLGPLTTTAGLIGIIEAILWSLFSAAVILLYHSPDIIQFQLDDAESNIGFAIYYLYLDQNDTIATNRTGTVVGPKEFVIFGYIYLILSVGLFIVSSVLLWMSIKNKKIKFQTLVVGLWITLISLMSILDLTLMILLATDYGKFESNANNTTQSNTTVAIYLAGIGVVLTIAARGFVLWILNVVFAVVLCVRCRVNNPAIKRPARKRSVIDAYTPGSVPWMDVATYDDSAFDNPAFRDDNENAIYPTRSPRQQPRYPDQDANDGLRHNERQLNSWNRSNGSAATPHFTPESDRFAAAPPRTAKIGRPTGQRSPPLSVPAPSIPEPDYSPPGSVKVKGVLRPQSNYIMY